MTLLKTPHRAPQSLHNGLASAATPPFHRLPVRRGPFNFSRVASSVTDNFGNLDNLSRVAPEQEKE
jgi:hypothetical protein